MIIALTTKWEESNGKRLQLFATEVNDLFSLRMTRVVRKRLRLVLIVIILVFSNPCKWAALLGPDLIVNKF